jgi:hypothetical protein
LLKFPPLLETTQYPGNSAPKRMGMRKSLFLFHSTFRQIYNIKLGLCLQRKWAGYEIPRRNGVLMLYVPLLREHLEL